MFAWTASTARSSALEGRSLDTTSISPIPPPPPSAANGSGPVLDPPPQSFPHRLEMVEGSFRQSAEPVSQLVRRPHTSGALDEGVAVGGEHRWLQMAGQFGPGLDLVMGEG